MKRYIRLYTAVSTALISLVINNKYLSGLIWQICSNGHNVDVDAGVVVIVLHEMKLTKYNIFNIS